MIELQQVSFAYPSRHQLFHDFSLTFPEGKITTILGSNGSGKSTLLKLAARLLTPQQGQVLLDKRDLNARIEPGAVIRDQVEIHDNAVIMMGAILNIGAIVGQGSMIDMGAVLGGRATVGKNCHVGAGAVLAGVIEPASATPVVIEDDVLIGANAVILEGVRVGRGAVVAAGAVVVADVPENTVVAGVPARIIKRKDEKATAKTALVDALREL